MAISTRPRFDIRINLLPSAQIEIADAKISSRRKLKRLAQRGEQLLIDVVKNSRQGGTSLFLKRLNYRDSIRVADFITSLKVTSVCSLEDEI